MAEARLLCDVADVMSRDGTGAVWSLSGDERQLDSNIVRLPPGGRIDEHVGPDLDVLVHVLAGSGSVTTGTATATGTATGVDPIPLAPGALVLLPRRSRRAIDAGPEGLAYLTVHRRRPALTITSAG